MAALLVSSVSLFGCLPVELARERASDGMTSTSGSADETSSSTAPEELESSSSGEPLDPGFVPDARWERHEVRFPSYLVPDAQTTYACASTSFTLSELEHIVAFEPAVDTPGVVHHMILGVAPEPVDGVVPCYPSAPGVTMYWGWAPGIQPLELPAEAGMLIGDQPGGVVHFVLQIHYENSSGHAGLVDRTGINVYTTADLRPHEAGVLSVGDVAGLAIPAGYDAFETIHDCPADFTQALLSEPIHVYGSWLHAHRLGKTLWTEQLRDGALIGEVGRNDPYDFGTQYVQPIDALIEPGDQLVTRCVYDSSDRTEPTLGGEGSDDEMCLNFLFHYPALPFSVHCNT